MGDEGWGGGGLFFSTDPKCLWYNLYVVEGRTVTPLLHKLFLGELHRYYSGYNPVRIPFE